MLAGCCDGGIHSSTGFADVSNSRCRNWSLLRHRIKAPRDDFEVVEVMLWKRVIRGKSGMGKYGAAPAGAGKQWRAERAGGQCRATGRHGDVQDRPDRRHDHARGARADRQPAKVLHVDHAGHSQHTSGLQVCLTGARHTAIPAIVCHTRAPLRPFRVRRAGLPMSEVCLVDHFAVGPIGHRRATPAAFSDGLLSRP